MSLFYSGSLLSGAFGNLIASGILKGLAGSRGLTAWQWLYIIEGSITAFVGICIAFLLPDFPHTWKKLSAEEKHVATKRLAIEAAQTDSDLKDWSHHARGVKMAMTDSRTYVLAAAYLCVVATSGFQNFFPTLVGTLGYNNTVSLALVAPPYLFCCVYTWIHGLLSDRMGKRFWFFIYPLPITIAGFVIFMASTNFGAKYFSFFLMVFIFAPTSTTFSLASASIPRPSAKRAISIAFINSVGNAASIFTPYFYFAGQGTQYLVANGLTIMFAVLAMVFGIAHRIQMGRINKQLERLEDSDLPLSEKDRLLLQRTASEEGVDIDTARAAMRGFRHML